MADGRATLRHRNEWKLSGGPHIVSTIGLFTELGKLQAHM